MESNFNAINSFFRVGGYNPHYCSCVTIPLSLTGSINRIILPWQYMFITPIRSLVYVLSISGHPSCLPSDGSICPLIAFQSIPLIAFQPLLVGISHSIGLKDCLGRWEAQIAMAGWMDCFIGLLYWLDGLACYLLLAGWGRTRTLLRTLDAYWKTVSQSHS